MHSNPAPPAASPATALATAFAAVLALAFAFAAPAQELTLPAGCAATAEDLSPLARGVLERVDRSSVLADSPVPSALLASTCNALEEVFVDGPAIFAGMRDAIAAARHEVALAFYAWQDEAQAADLIGDGLRAAAANPEREGKLLVRLIVKDNRLPGSGRTINHLYDSAKKWQLDPERVTLQLATYPHTLLGVLHDKYVVVDGRVTVIAGANVETHHDAPTPWHDSAYRLRGTIALAALHSFDEAWNDHAKHWTCRPQTAQFDCEGTDHPRPQRPWLSEIDFGNGTTPMIAVGRMARGGVNNSVDNPQDQAWLAVMDGATRSLHVESPNLNDDAFKAAVVRAAARGVEVRVITARGFNKFIENAGQGGFNREVVGDLRQIMRSQHPAQRENLQLCWFSRDGRHPVGGNGPHASHTKFMSVDGAVAIVGSGNMDTQSWNHSREFNVLIDDPAAVARIEDAFFTADWARATCQLVELWEGNGASQDLACSKGALDDHGGELSDDFCVDDEARSLVLHHTPAGRVFRLYDDPDGSREDDWVEIVVRRDVVEKVVPTFERSFEDADLRVTYHRNDGLDGKVSRFEGSSRPSGATVDLYEGGNGSQNMVCSLSVARDAAFDFQRHPECDNDEARSLRLLDLPAGRALLLFDSPRGDRDDDWTLIETKRAVRDKVIPGFERSFEDADVRVSTFHHNGLDGKVSRLQAVDPRRLPASLTFYEGNGGSQNKVCTLPVRGGRVNFKNHGECDNDEARSATFFHARRGTVVTLHDDPGCGTGDDWTRIRVKRDLGVVNVASFERSFENADLDVDFHRDNGLDGKVSCVAVSAPGR